MFGKFKSQASSVDYKQVCWHPWTRCWNWFRRVWQFIFGSGEMVKVMNCRDVMPLDNGPIPTDYWSQAKKILTKQHAFSLYCYDTSVAYTTQNLNTINLDVVKIHFLLHTFKEKISVWSPYLYSFMWLTAFVTEYSGKRKCLVSSENGLHWKNFGSLVLVIKALLDWQTFPIKLNLSSVLPLISCLACVDGFLN